MDGWINTDIVELPGVDVVTNLAYGPPSHPFADDSIDEFLLSHVIEHVPNAMLLMERLHRIAKTNALMTIRVPHGSSDDAWEDQTHVRPYFGGSFGYFSQPYYWRADYGYRGDWQIDGLTYLMHDIGSRNQHDYMEAIKHRRNSVIEMIATMRAIKPIRAPRRELQVAPTITINVVPNN